MGELTHQRPVWAQRLGGELTADTGSHVHDYMAMAFFTEGYAVVHQRETFEVRAGDVYLVPAGEPHSIVHARSPEVWGISFCPACYATTELAPLLDPFGRAASGASKVVHIPGSKQEHVASMCRELFLETTKGAGAAHAALVQKNLLTLILAEVARAGPCTAGGSQPRTDLVSDTLRFIERSCLGPLSLTDVATFVNRSPSHVSTVVRQATGKSVKDWIIAGRLAEARNRLLHTDEMVDVIAERVGYADSTHFIRLFRREHGCTPASWRSKHRHALRPDLASPARR